MSSRKPNNNVMVSGTVPQNNNLNDYVIKVNKILTGACSKRNIGFIDNKKTKPRMYNCNLSRMQLNRRKTNLLIENILFSLSNEIISDSQNKSQMKISLSGDNMP